ncbi:YncE family protein [Naasia lichenicola]|uniref:YncE family protein n=1 Tax=Naasia lichenicola TaxID=2565933 RepID=A0A4V6RYY8_9MICO|nr:YncE family protein [Naasia lichenicola]THG28447.1 YncE family protein [Naasia lichenicola]
MRAVVTVPALLITIVGSMAIGLAPASASVVTPGPTVQVGSGAGSQPVGIAFNPTGTRAYVTLSGDSAVAIVDPATNQQIGTSIPVGHDPLSIAISADGLTAYTANYGSGTGSVSVITLSNNAVTTVPLPPTGTSSSGFFIALDPVAPKAYVADVGGTVQVFDTVTNTFAAPIAGAFSAPVAVAFTPDGAKAYVANYGTSNISVIDVASGAVTRTIPLSGRPYGVAISPDGNKAYASQANGGFITPIDVLTDTALPDIAAAASLQSVTFSPDGSRVYVPSPSGVVDVIDVSTNTLLPTIPVGAGARLLAFAPGGNFAYVGNTGAGTLSALAFAPDPVIAPQQTQIQTQNQTLTSVSADSSPVLASTGVDATALASAGGIGAAMLALGMAFIVMSRLSVRRRRS